MRRNPYEDPKALRDAIENAYLENASWNAGLILSATGEELSAWFLISFTTGNFAPFHFHKVASVVSQLDVLTKDAPGFIKAKLSSAVTSAIGAWDLEKNGIHAAKDLAFVASDLRAQDAVAPLVIATDIVVDHDQDDHAMGNLVGVVAGFTKVSKDSRKALRKWIDDPRFGPYAGQCMHGLIEADPENFPLYLEKFLAIERQHPDWFETDYMFANLPEYAGLEQFVKGLKTLSPETAERILKALEDEEKFTNFKLDRKNATITNKETGEMAHYTLAEKI